MKKLISFCFIAGTILLALPAQSFSYSKPIEAVRPPIRQYAKEMTLKAFGGHWTAMEAIINKESHWNHHAKNPKSSAYGLCQFLKSTWKDKKTSDPYKQIDECIVYVQERYGNPQKAQAFHVKHNWF
jgi:membrane-bound lytic murein transglycosylase MltF